MLLLYKMLSQFGVKNISLEQDGNLYASLTIIYILLV